MKNILVFGGAGMLGHKLVQVFARKGYRVFTTVREQDPVEYLGRVKCDCSVIPHVDVTVEEHIVEVFKKSKPDVVLNAVGIIKQKDEAKMAEPSIAVNALLPHRLGRIASEHSAKLITFSTDCVFSDKSSGPHKQADVPSPDDLYGRTKLLGEVGGMDNVLTLRTSIVGRELYAPKQSLIEWIFSQNGGTVQGYKNALYTGLTTYEIAKMVEWLIGNDVAVSGVWHVGSESISKYDLIATINKVFELGITLEENSTFHCDRRLDSTPFAEKTKYPVPSWEQMIMDLKVDAATTLYGID